MEQAAIPQRISHVLHWIGDVTSKASSSLIVTFVLVVYLVVLATKGFPGRWQTGFSTVAEAITLIMLFVIQHTQSRQQTVLQLKLDELIRSSPEADDHLVHLEAAEDAELIELEQQQVAHHEWMREPDDESSDAPGNVES